MFVDEESLRKRGSGCGGEAKAMISWEGQGNETNIPCDARAAGLIVALSAPFGCAAYMSAVGVDNVNGPAKRRVLI